MSDDSLESVIREVMDARVADVHTALPAQVVRYDAALQVADVQPMVRDVYYTTDGAMRTRSFPVLPSVPVAFLRGGGFFVSLPLAVGDTGMLIFSELPIDRWRSTGQEAHPVNARRHGVGNAVFYPGVRPRAQALDEDGVDENLVLGKEGGAQIHVSDDEINLGEKTAAQAVALAQKVQADLNKLRDAFNSHVHATAGAGAPSTPTPAPGIPVVLSGDVGAEKVRAT